MNNVCHDDNWCILNVLLKLSPSAVSAIHACDTSVSESIINNYRLSSQTVIIYLSYVRFGTVCLIKMAQKVIDANAP